MEELIKDAFKYLNTYKRFRAMNDSARSRGNNTEAEGLELKMYKAIDQLELTLRGIQRAEREEE